ncbi:MAG: hypothetical protein ACUVS7_02670 [Bryobacteraceae bacterium]
MKGLIVLLPAAGAEPARQSLDLVVYAGTAASMMTAVSGARQGIGPCCSGRTPTRAAW